MATKGQQRFSLQAPVAIVSDLAIALKLTFESSASTLLRSWLYVPFGIMVMLLACFGVDSLFRHVGLSFPASVACLILLFFGLLLCEVVLGAHRTRRLVAVIDIPAQWSLRWINVFFMPTFVLLPLSPKVGIVEVLKIIAVFIVGFIAMTITTAYMTRGLQLLTGSSKRSHAERAEELSSPNNIQEEEIPISRTPSQFGFATPVGLSSRETSSIALSSLIAPPRRYDPSNTSSQNPILSPNPGENPVLRNSVYRQIPLPPAQSRVWAAHVTSHLDLFTYASLALFIGIPMFYGIRYSLPLHTCITILAYYAAMSLPATWRRFLHPVLVSALITVLSIWIIGLTIGNNLNATLLEYRTGLKYLQLWEGRNDNTTGSNILPGAGDLFGTVLDASIVSLALPMHQYRRELREHFAAIIIPNIVLSIGSLFAYPIICFAIGISAERSLAFAARSLTLALATPAMVNLGGDLNTVSAVAIMSGVVGALLGSRMLRLMKIPEGDYVTRGVTLGANSSAIATAMLLQSDPRGAALSSLSMSLFGTITVLFTSIPPIKDLVRSMVGL
ncbi:LrgB-like family-domain-containing protein [Podospora didyma]|uniref:LrgB-like family-domain-containing protein n=1 Tax=Podospora didyma TaxID=330526 RepID=A0AAE0NPQ3_9PEZI|nr:LrgB-like family-domain-containing protein [Podospora didyma]